jgi:Alkaline phosphatase
MRLASLLALFAAPACSPAASATARNPPRRPSEPALTGAAAHAPPSTTAGTLAQVADGRAARTRLAYANVDALRAADLPVAPDRILARQLGLVPAAGVLADPPPADAAPAVSAITPVAASAAQSSLGDPLVQTILGPRTMGRDAALGVGPALSGDAPAGVQLRICGAPHHLRDVHATEHALEERFGRVSAVVGEREIGDREIVFAKIDPSRPKNVILLVGDGMGDSEVTLARYYGKGAAGRLNMDRLPFRGSSIH